MLIFPQLSTGATAQYPVHKEIARRTTGSMMEDGTIVCTADPAANWIRWSTNFRDLSDLEAQSLTNFFGSTQGELQSFLFLDPTTNLLLWSEDFSNSAWSKSGVTFDSAVPDPFGGRRAWRAHAAGPVAGSLFQDTQIPGLAQVCFSVYLRSYAPVTATLVRAAGSQSQTVSIDATNVWQRCQVSGSLAGLNDLSRFAITVPAGSALEVFGAQVDAQVNPATYVTSSGTGSGIYPNARFDMPQIQVVATGPNRNSCAVLIRSNLSVGVNS